MSDHTANGQSHDARRPWVAPALIAHASLTALTQSQYQQQYPYDPAMGPMTPEQAALMGIPCSGGGFCFT